MSKEINSLSLISKDDSYSPSFPQDQVNMVLSLTLYHGVHQFHKSMVKLNKLADKLSSHLESQLDYALESDTLSLEDTLSTLNSIQNKQIQILDLIRKISQGKPVVSNNLTYEERVVVQLFNSFSSKDEKSKFLQLVESQLGSTPLTFAEPNNSSSSD